MLLKDDAKLETVKVYREVSTVRFCKRKSGEILEETLLENIPWELLKSEYDAKESI